MKARLYYEAHITVDGKSLDDDWPSFEKAARHNDFRASRFDVDEVDHYDGAWFLSYRDMDLDNMKLTMRNAVMWLEDNAYTVKRWKIEDTLLDSKHGDTL